MTIVGNLALLAGAKGRGKSRFAGATSTPAALSVRRGFSSPASTLLRLPPLARSAAERCSLAVVGVARRHSSYHGDSRVYGINVRENTCREVKRKSALVSFLALLICVGILAVKWMWAMLC